MLRADVDTMSWDLMNAVLYLGVIALAFRGGAPMEAVLPTADQPPPGSKVPMPRAPMGLKRYVGRGLAEIDEYLGVSHDSSPADRDRGGNGEESV